MAGRWTVGTTVIRHHLSMAPRLTYVSANSYGTSRGAGKLSAIRGILIALALSAIIWAVLLTVVL